MRSAPASKICSWTVLEKSFLQIVRTSCRKPFFKHALVYYSLRRKKSIYLFF